MILSKEAEKDLDSLPPPEKKKVIKKLLFLENNPLSGKLLTGKLEDIRSLKAWPYRILYEFKDLKVIVHRITHRQGAYK